MWPRSFLPVFLVLTLLPIDASRAGVAPDPDSLYSALHPRLAFTRDEVPALRAKMADGGHDDEAYATIRALVAGNYPTSSLGQLMNIGYGQNLLLNLGLVSHLDGSDAARQLGRHFTLALADSLAADDNTFFAPIRLRALCYGYDLCLDVATPSERARVRAEIESYVDSIMVAFNFERWLHPPYTSNITAMIGASLGIAAICLADEMSPGRVEAALARADRFVETWMQYHLDPGGTCFEGVQYGTWAMRHLAWYFEARRRYDGTDYSAHDGIRQIERWLAYEVLPEQGGAVNNLNDTAYLNHPIARHNTYLEWALYRWNSGLAAWLWDRQLGAEDGYDWGELEDLPATALWHHPVHAIDPDRVLPHAFLWTQRGLYYYRTGWPSHGRSDDVVFSFYSGQFHGGHSQEDQNGFTLYAFGSRFAADNGFDRQNGVSAAHNMVFIDGKGQHYSGGSTGTDGEITNHLLTPYADYLLGDATAAYSTHSPYNNPGVPFPDSDWSAGYLNANPVQHARREWLAVHGSDAPPYFVLLDDVKKDDATRTYAWRMHTDASLGVDTSQPALRIDGPRGALEIDVCHPAPGDLVRSIEPYENTSADPNTHIVTLSTTGPRGLFALVLRPLGGGRPSPAVTTVTHPWGGIDVIQWPQGPTDVIVANAGTDTVSAMVPLPDGTSMSVRTDARLLHVRRAAGQSDRYALVRVQTADIAGTRVLRAASPITAVVAGAYANIDRADAIARVYAPGVSRVQAGGHDVRFTREGSFISIPASAVPAGAAALRVHPQPARGAATIVLDADAAGTVDIDVFDVAGRRVRSLQAISAPGTTQIPFDGRDDLAQPLASGIYFLRAREGTRSLTAKFVLVR